MLKKKCCVDLYNYYVPNDTIIPIYSAILIEQIAQKKKDGNTHLSSRSQSIVHYQSSIIRVSKAKFLGCRL